MNEIWETKVLICPYCASENLQGKIPKIMCNNCGCSLNFDKNNILKTDIAQNLGVEFHERMESGTTLRELQSRFLHLAYWETPYYNGAIKDWIVNLIKDEWIALDVGCGDGRFTDLLVELGVKKIVASDCNLHSLESLAEHAIAKNYREKLLIIQSDVTNIPIRKSGIDLVLSVGVLYYLNQEFEKGLSSMVSLLKKGGYFIDSEPDLEGCSLKALLFEGINDFILTLKEKVFTEINNGIPFKFRTFDRNEIKRHYQKSRLKVLDYHGLSIFPSLLSIGKIKQMFNENDIELKESDLRQVFNFFDENGRIFKHIMWLCRK